ncbi:hypothetical protein COLO4_07516 [Corchorus olitorius]|uniref:Uncharacterized protein n=1 Tax=Corchorus olitorius TaxID=93759 RepID=A0A1R3KJS1_9ROSI|nr:hypothetical protein COLO4_07516 [Corchorus olitorius]
MAVWIQLPNLPVEYYGTTTLHRITAFIGTPVKIDAQTSTASRTHYARICVEVEMGRCLPKSIVIEAVVQPIRYEIKTSFCLTCSMIGHKQQTCALTKTSTNSESNPPSTSPEIKEEWQLVDRSLRRWHSTRKPEDSLATAQGLIGPRVPIHAQSIEAHNVDKEGAQPKSQQNGSIKAKQTSLLPSKPQQIWQPKVVLAQDPKNPNFVVSSNSFSFLSDLEDSTQLSDTISLTGGPSDTPFSLTGGPLLENEICDSPRTPTPQTDSSTAEITDSVMSYSSVFPITASTEPNLTTMPSNATDCGTASFLTTSTPFSSSLILYNAPIPSQSKTITEPPPSLSHHGFSPDNPNHPFPFDPINSTFPSHSSPPDDRPLPPSLIRNLFPTNPSSTSNFICTLTHICPANSTPDPNHDSTILLDRPAANSSTSLPSPHQPPPSPSPAFEFSAVRSSPCHLPTSPHPSINTFPPPTSIQGSTYRVRSKPFYLLIPPLLCSPVPGASGSSQVRNSPSRRIVRLSWRPGCNLPSQVLCRAKRETPSDHTDPTRKQLKRFCETSDIRNSIMTSETLSIRKMVRIVSWNCRGVGRPEFLAELRQLLNLHRPHILIILEIRINDVRAEHIILQLALKGRLISAALG